MLSSDGYKQSGIFTLRQPPDLSRFLDFKSLVGFHLRQLLHEA